MEHMNDSTPWYVAHTKPRQERVAQENLLRQGYGVYLPLLKVFKNVRNRQETRLEPLFPRYLFFQPADAQQSIAPVRSTQGITSIVRFGQAPAVLYAETLKNIQAFEARQNAASFEEISALKPGTAVVVTEGPFAGLEGLVSMASEQRVVVLMQLLGKQQRLKFSPQQLSVKD